MRRRNFIKNAATYSLSGFLTFKLLNTDKYKDLIIGHNSHQYKVDLKWGALNSNEFPVNDCHEMVQDSKGRIVLLTNHSKNNVIIYNKSGKLIEVWGTEFPGAHGLTLNVENGKDYLYITDTLRHEVIKTTIDGKVVQIFPFPKESGKYTSAEKYIPTETAVAANGDVFVADGYGLQYILHYNSKGKLLNIFGGKGDQPWNFENAHGICIDTRNKEMSLLITARTQNKLKQFSMDGKLLGVIDLPGAFICRPVVHKKHIYLATIWSGEGKPNSGFISILNEKNRLISAPGGSTPTYKKGKLQGVHQTLKIFQHPHDVCVDDDENLYVAQWNAGKTYPIKLNRV